MKLKTEELKRRHDSAFLCRRETGEEQEEAMKLRMDSAIMDDQNSSGDILKIVSFHGAIPPELNRFFRTI